MARAIRLAHEIEGDGPWLVMLHGFSQSRALWSAQRPVFAPRYRLLLPDLRGHGDSDAPESGYGPVEYAADLLALMDERDVHCAHFWGTHTGASVSLYLAAEHPNRVASLVLDGAVIPGQTLPAVARHMAQAREMALRDGVDATRRWWFDNVEFWEGVRSQPERHRAEEHRRMIERFSGAPWVAPEPPQPVPDIAARIPEIHQPTLLINGVDDHPEFFGVAERLERELPNARRYLIPGAGAFPLWEEPDAVNPVVMQFLDEID